MTRPWLNKSFNASGPPACVIPQYFGRYQPTCQGKDPYFDKYIMAPYLTARCLVCQGTFFTEKFAIL